jgi:hypothetical protein
MSSRLESKLPNHADIKVVRANVDLDWKADTQPLHQVIDEIRAENPASVRGIANNWLIARWRSATPLPQKTP